MASNPVPLPPDLAGIVEPFPLDELDAALLDPNDPGDLPRVRRWRVEDDGAAEWAMRHLAAIEAERAAVEAQAAVWVEQIADWQARRSGPLVHRAEFFRAHLEDYAMRRREADPKTKSVTLPSGVVRTTLRQPQVTVADEAAFLRWATAELDSGRFTEVVKVVESVRLTELRKMVRMLDVPGRVVMSCGCSVELADDDPSNVDWWSAGSAQTCPECKTRGTVVKWADVVAVPVIDVDGVHLLPAGLDVTDATLSAKATPEVP